jgi:hypothetical protein
MGFGLIGQIYIYRRIHAIECLNLPFLTQEEHYTIEKSLLKMDLM